MCFVAFDKKKVSPDERLTDTNPLLSTFSEPNAHFWNGLFFTSCNSLVMFIVSNTIYEAAHYRHRDIYSNSQSTVLLGDSNCLDL